MRLKTSDDALKKTVQPQEKITYNKISPREERKTKMQWRFLLQKKNWIPKNGNYNDD